MKSIIFIISIVIILSSCKKNKVTYWEISHFNISDSLIKENEEIKLLYYSNGLEEDKEREYYYHFVAYTVNSNDTFNILNPYKIKLDKIDEHEVYLFIPEYSNIYKIFDKMNYLFNNPELKADKIIPNESINIQRRLKVFRDPKLDDIADNNYPTVIGTFNNNNTTFEK